VWSLKIKGIFANILIFIAGCLNSLKLSIIRLSVKVHDPQLTIEILEQISNDPEEFKRFARQLSESLDENDQELKEATYLYFLTKQAASIYEAKIQYLPLQVYNEMRNALDHYFRALITEDTNRRSSHIGKMEGHLQRAFLDITKLTCAATIEEIDLTHKRIGEKGINFVNNGEYIKFITNLKINAEDKLICAKRSEYTLGDGGEHSVRDNYIEALSAHILVHNYYKNNLGNLEWGRVKWFFLKPVNIFLTLFVTIVASAISGYLVRVMWAASEELPIIKQLINCIKLFAT
jgi:hypothetical protein